MRSAPEPGGFENVSMGTEGVEVRKTTVTSAGYVTMWNTDTYESAVMNMNSVRTKLRETFPADHPRKPNQPAWTASDPSLMLGPAGEVIGVDESKKPWRGTATCPLHASRPERAAYNLQGYPECDRIELPNEAEAQRHLLKKHPDTYRQINEVRIEADRKSAEEDRIINRRILAKLVGVDLDEVTPEEPSAPEVPSVWDDGTHTAATTSSTTLTYAEDVTPPIILHAHRYGKAMGAKCKVAGCTSVRTTAFKARSKK